ncbi:uncharacterized protein J8A68_002448 [[Candida] subhashii]|uniref:Ribophorin II C-terminal domain-containing protein n=1 Tax=[Candida] subhashii TaxID=561895 RepID=A0A8J5UY05_9ASCO|nr:uncharacterized protein J8A68_002448 [[Candida] subhashii]KAG7664010.1 hypothetical protein J8A68_002448 [[Candida] subhashii]
MKFIFTVFILNALTALAYSNLEGYVKIGKNKVSFGEIETQEVKQLFIDSPRDFIDVSLECKDMTKRPDQVVLSLSDFSDPSLVTHFVPTVTDEKIRTSIKAVTLPEVLKSKDKLILQIIIADSTSSKNLYRKLVEIFPSPEFQQSSNYKPKERLGIQPEIHHIFKQDEKDVNPVIPVAFIGISITLFFVFLGTWFRHAGKELLPTLKTISWSQLTCNIVFLICIFGFELNFVMYYLGQSIFTTLYYGAVLSVATVYFGVRVLRSLAQNRVLGK